MNNLNIKVKKEAILPVYRDYLFDYSHRYNVYYGGRGSGKTKFIIQKLLLKGLQEKRLILLMRKETNKLRDSVYNELLQIIREWKLQQYFTVNRTEFRITCKLNGTEFKCLGLDDSEKIKGFAEVADVFLDEVTGFTAEDIDLIDGTLRSSTYKLPLQFYFAFNPISKANFVYKYFGFDKGTPRTTADYFYLKTTYLDNPFLSDSFVIRMEQLKLRNYNRWKVEAEGDFVSLDKLVFNNWQIAEKQEFKGDLLVGLDFGFVNDISALICSLVNEEAKEIYIFREWGDTGKTNDDLANIIINMGLAKSVIIADSAEQKSIEELRRHGIRRIAAAAKGKDSIIHGIQKLQQYDIYVHPDCTGIITEFENYSWQKDKSSGEYINKPNDKFNHFIDALRYSLQCKDKQNKLSTLSKGAFGL